MFPDEVKVTLESIQLPSLRGSLAHDVVQILRLHQRHLQSIKSQLACFLEVLNNGSLILFILYKDTCIFILIFKFLKNYYECDEIDEIELAIPK